MLNSSRFEALRVIPNFSSFHHHRVDPHRFLAPPLLLLFRGAAIRGAWASKSWSSSTPREYHRGRSRYHRHLHHHHHHHFNSIQFNSSTADSRSRLCEALILRSSGEWLPETSVKIVPQDLYDYPVLFSRPCTVSRSRILAQNVLYVS